jgi:hypothetical protein
MRQALELQILIAESISFYTLIFCIVYEDDVDSRLNLQTGDKVNFQCSISNSS